LTVVNDGNVLKGISLKSEGDGKLNIHGCGIATFRSHDRPKNHSLIINGNRLFDKEKKTAGARHLFTTFMNKPTFIPNSPALNRKSDYPIQTNEELSPYVIMFFAIPQSQTGFKINFEFSLSIDEMNNIPGDMLGGNLFSLRYHDLFWFAYRTKNMTNWPKNKLVCYDDGFKVPVFVGLEDQQYRLEYRNPKYSLIGDQFTINCSISDTKI